MAYTWPVDRIGPTHRPDAPPASPTLILIRRDAGMQVHFAALSPLFVAPTVARLDAWLAEHA